MRLATGIVFAILAAALVLPASASTGTPSFTNYIRNPLATFGAGEPSIGVNPQTGAAFFQWYTQTWKVTWNDNDVATWTDVSAPIQPMQNFDPLLYTDQTTGRTFAGGLTPYYCSHFSMTDDDGETWLPVTMGCPFLASDHPSIGGGPYHAPAPATAALYPNAVYVCQQSGTNVCVASWDGGLTFNQPVTVYGCNSFHGHVKVAPDGTAYVPSAYCGGRQGGYRSVNNGMGWTMYDIPQSQKVSNGGGFDPSVAITPDNTLYEAWSDGRDFHPWIARSTDQGRNWERAVDLANTVTPPIRVSTFQAVVAGDNDRVAVAFLGSTDGVGNPFGGNFVGSWDLYVSFTFDGGLSWQTVKATTNPVQRGCIYDVITSPSCHRNLLDFMDATITPDGRVLVAYADGCVSATCIGPNGGSNDSTADMGVIARQTGGQRLYAAFD